MNNRTRGPFRITPVNPTCVSCGDILPMLPLGFGWYRVGPGGPPFGRGCARCIGTMKRMYVREVTK